MKMSITGIVQARMNSIRLPGKVFAIIEGKPLIWHIINRIKRSRSIEKIIVATTVNKADDVLQEWSREQGISCFRGDEHNVLERFYFAAIAHKADIIVRITSDDPFKDPELTDKAVEILINEDLDFVYNNNPPTYPEGLDTEVFTFDALERAYRSATDSFELEHVTQHLYRHPQTFSQKNFGYCENLSHLRWTIDQEKDLEMARMVYKYLYRENDVFLMQDILDLLRREPWIAKINIGVERSSMYKNIGGSDGKIR